MRWVLGPEGYYMLLDNTGTGDFDSVVTTVGDAAGSAALRNTFSIAAKIRWASGSGVILGGPTGSYNFRLSGGKQQISWSSLLDLGTGTATLTNGLDYWVGCTYDGSLMQFYLNGKPDGSVSISGASPTLQQNYIGARYPGSERPDNGSRVYWIATSDRIWNAAQFAALAGPGWLDLWEPRTLYFIPGSDTPVDGNASGDFAAISLSAPQGVGGVTAVGGFDTIDLSPPAAVGGVTATGGFDAIDLSAPQGNASAGSDGNASGAFAAINLSAPAASGVGNASASGPFDPIHLTPPTGVANPVVIQQTSFRSNLLDVDPRLPYDGDVAQLRARLYELLQQSAINFNLVAQGRLAGQDSRSSAPTTGQWAQGDQIRNATPTELGSIGNKYVVVGWICTSGGAPGTWKELRQLTGA